MTRSKPRRIAPSRLVALTLCFAPWVAAQGDSVDPEAAAYLPAAGIKGSLVVASAATSEAFLKRAAEKFQALHPGVKVTVDAKGSSLTLPALASGAAQIAFTNHVVLPEELEQCETKLGKRPVTVRVSFDAILVYAHRDNPLRTIALPQIAAIYTAGAKEFRKWSDVGVTGKLAESDIVALGLPASRSTTGYFRAVALGGGSVRSGVPEILSSEEIVKAVSQNPAAIGFATFGVANPAVKALWLTKTGGAGIEPTGMNIMAGDYPLGRALLAHALPGNAVGAEFLRFLLSREGGKLAVENNHLALPASICANEVAKLQ